MKLWIKFIALIGALFLTALALFYTPKVFAQQGSIWFPTTDDKPQLIFNITDGCATWSSNVLTTTGTACGSGGGGSFPFTPRSWGNSTSTIIGFTQGIISNASSTFTASTTIAGVLTASGGIYGNLTGLASLATALNADGANCSAGNFPLGVDQQGAVQNCTDAWTEAENTTAGYARFAYTPTTNYGTNANATSTPIWFQAGLQASSTSRFDKIDVGSSTNSTMSTSTFFANLSVRGNASTSALTISNLAAGGLGVDANGKVYSGPTSTLATISGTLALTQLATQAANTVVANGTGATAAPTALSTTSLFAATAGQVLTFANGVWTGVATTTNSCSSGVSCTYSGTTWTFTNSGVTSVIAGSGISVSGPTGAVTVTATFPFTPTTSFGATANSTSTRLLFTQGIEASTTLRVGNNNGQILSYDSSTGRLGVGTSSPFAQLAIQASTTNGVALPQYLFVVASSSAAPNTTLFSINQLGTTTLGNFGACSGTRALTTDASGNIVCGTITGSGGSSFPFTPAVYSVQNVNSTSTGLWLTGSPLSLIASSTFATNATTTNATSTNFYTTVLGINSEYFTDLTGTGLSLSGGALTNTGVISGSCSGGTTCSGTNPLTINSFSYPFPSNATTTLLSLNGGASTTLLSILDTLYIGRTATSTIQGNTTGTSTLQGFLNVAGTNSTSTFSAGLAASRLDTSATSTLAGIVLENILNCTQALETDANGGIICGTDQTGAGASFPFTPDSYAGVTVNSTTTPLWLKATSPFSLIASSSLFTQASTSLLTVSGNAWFTGLSAGALALDSSGLLYSYATTSSASGSTVTDYGTSTVVGAKLQINPSISVIAGDTVAIWVTANSNNGTCVSNTYVALNLNYKLSTDAASTTAVSTVTNSGEGGGGNSSCSSATSYLFTATTTQTIAPEADGSAGTASISQLTIIAKRVRNAAMNGNFAFPYTPNTNYALNVNSTSTPLWFTQGFMSSTTAYLQNATTSLLTITGQASASGQNCLQIDTTGFVTKTGSACSTGSGTFSFTPATHFGTTTNATTTPIWFQGNLYSLMASGTAVFTKASTSQITIGTDFITDLDSSFSITAAGVVSTSLGTSISASEIADGDHGDFTYSGGAATLDADTVSDSEIDYSTVTLNDFTNDGDYVKWANATSSIWKTAGLLATGSSTINGNATTTGTHYSTIASSSQLFGAGLFECSDAADTLNWNNGIFTCGTDAEGTGGGSFPFTVDSNFGVLANSTNTPIWFKAGLQASSTSQFVNATTSQLTINNLLYFDSQQFDSLTDDATLDNNGGDLQVVDVTCTGCLGTTEIAGLDISDDTNLAASWPATITGDTIGWSATTSPWAANQFVYTNNAGLLVSVASSSLSLPNTALQNSSINFSYTGMLSGSASAALGGTATINSPSWPWLTATNFGSTTHSTTTPLWLRTNLYASSTIGNPSVIDNLVTTNSTSTNATTTSLKTTNLTLGGDAVITDITGSGLSISSGALTVSSLTTSNFSSANVSQWTNDAAYTKWPWTLTNVFGTANQNSTSTIEQLTGGLTASSTVRFGNTGILSQFLWDSTRGALGIGTSTPYFSLSIASSTGSQISISDGTNPPFNLRAIGGSFYISTSSLTTFATSSRPVLSIVGTSPPSLSIGSTTQTVSAVNGLITQGTNGDNGSSTISAGKWQLDFYNSAGTRSCMFVLGTTLTVIAGACNP